MAQDKKIALFRISFTRNLQAFERRSLQVFERQSLQVFDLIRIRSKFKKGTCNGQKTIDVWEIRSSSQAPRVNKTLFGTSPSADCQNVFHLSTSFPRDLGNGLSFSQNSMPSTSAPSCSALFTKIDDTRQV